MPASAAARACAGSGRSCRKARAEAASGHGPWPVPWTSVSPYPPICAGVTLRSMRAEDAQNEALCALCTVMWGDGATQVPGSIC